MPRSDENYGQSESETEGVKYTSTVFSESIRLYGSRELFLPVKKKSKRIFFCFSPPFTVTNGQKHIEAGSWRESYFQL